MLETAHRHESLPQRLSATHELHEAGIAARDFRTKMPVLAEKEWNGHQSVVTVANPATSRRAVDVIVRLASRGSLSRIHPNGDYDSRHKGLN